MPTAVPPLEALGATAVPEALSHGYAGSRAAYDEMVDDLGTPRPHWRSFLRHLDALGAGALTRRWQQARDMIRENGVSFNVYGDPHGLERPWELSPVPVLVDPGEFAELSQGLAQRARLLDRLLADLYGPQRSLTEGWLPPEIVFGQPSYLRPMHGIVPPQGRFLHFYAADVGRDPAGTFQVLTDRTQAPAGAGYALENRIVVSRVLPEIFRDCNVQRLALYFREVRRTLESLAPGGRENPRVVLLSPGPYSVTAFEQVFLAQYLGYMLVEGADLVVRGGGVFLKTLGGLHRVDVILRRLNDDHCDPLELRPDSALGVPGLVQAIREGQVAVANTLGSGLLQTPALGAFLPSLARGLLGEELRLPSVETWWCGDPASLSHVLAHLPEMVVKPVYSAGPINSIFGDTLGPQQREELSARLRASPAGWVAQARLRLSTTPVVEGSVLGAREVVLRTFLVAGADDTPYHTMPGALALVAGGPGARDISMQGGAGSKDTWVVSAGPVTAHTLLPPVGHAIELSRGGGDLPSRVADNLFWLGRYAERADATARVGRAIASRLFEQPDTGPAGEVALLLAALRLQTHTAAGAPVPVRSAAASVEGELLMALFGDEHRGTLRASLRAVHRVARAIRDRITLDTWRVVTALESQAGSADLGRDTDGTSGLSRRLDRVVTTSAALAGLVAESMTRGLAWRFLDMGRRLERAVNTLLVLGATATRPTDREGALLEALLETADSSITYRRRYRASLQVTAVVDLLLVDATNPRSVAFQLEALGQHLRALPRDAGGVERDTGDGVLCAAMALLETVDLGTVCTPADDGSRPALAALLAEIQRALPAISDALSGSYLTHAVVARQLSERTIGVRT
jgi:uncharacterized circularly permuted ATP-grasp superfamily protein/uncharacterized alpha-E superfamily protein